MYVRFGMLALSLALVAQAACTAAPGPATTKGPEGSMAGTAATQAAGKAPLRKVTLDNNSNTAIYGPYLVALNKGYYAEEGLDVEIVQSGAAAAALMAGQVDFTTSASTSLSAILKGADMRIVLTQADRPGLQIWSSQPDIATLGALKGKSLGVISRGDSLEISARLALIKAGIDPESVAFTALGTGSTRLAALQSGAITAAVISTADGAKLKQSGPKGNLLADLAVEVKMLYNGVATSGKLLREQPQVVEAFLRGTLKGREYVKRYKDPTLDVLVKYNGNTREVNEIDYDQVLTTLTEDGSLSEDVQLLDTKVRAHLVDVSAIPPLSQIYDYSLLRRANEQLKQSGWQPKP